ncbi:MAG: hypothetical protein M3347_16775 [Armatimonadota bacterium]|nr:hypothetical protein [Armatimonadota bacterium]
MTNESHFPQIDPHQDKWIDFYALLNAPVGADEMTLRQRIEAIRAEATTNWEHPDIARRLYYHRIVEQVLPQCQRVLFNRNWRDQYNQFHARHRAGDPTATDYRTFVATLSSYTPRVIVDEVQPTHPASRDGWFKPGVTVLSPRSINLLTGIVAVLLMATIQGLPITPM